MAAFSGNSFFRTLLTMLATALPRIPTTMRPRTLPITLYTMAQGCPSIAPQVVPVNLIRFDGSPALAGHYIVDIIAPHDGQGPSEHFVGSGLQTIPLTGYQVLKAGDILGTALAPLLRVLLEVFALQDVQNNVTLVAESPLSSASSSLATNVSPDTSNKPFSELLYRLHDDQRELFLWLLNTVPSPADRHRTGRSRLGT